MKKKFSFTLLAILLVLMLTLVACGGDGGNEDNNTGLIPAVGQTFVDPENANLTWRVLADYDGHALLVTENVWSLGQEIPDYGHPNNRWNETQVFRQLENAYLRRAGHLNNWYQTTVGTTIQSMAVNYGFVPSGGLLTGVQRNNSRNTLLTGKQRNNQGAGIELDMSDNSNTGLPIWTDPSWRCNRDQAFTASCGWTRAISRPTGNPGNGEPFILSQTEVQTFFGLDNESPTNASRQASGGTAHGWLDSGFRHWWLRSPGEFDTYGNSPFPVRAVWSNGNLTACNVLHPYVGVRPALWIRR